MKEQAPTPFAKTQLNNLSFFEEQAYFFEKEELQCAFFPGIIPKTISQQQAELLRGFLSTAKEDQTRSVRSKLSGLETNYSSSIYPLSNPNKEIFDLVLPHLQNAGMLLQKVGFGEYENMIANACVRLSQTPWQQFAVNEGSALKLHVDCDIGFSVIITLGSYEGGFFYCPTLGFVLRSIPGSIILIRAQANLHAATPAIGQRI